MTVRELVVLGGLEHLPVPKERPACPDSYVKGGELSFVKPDEVKAATFYNGISGAGLSIGTHGDGSYMVRGEIYKGQIRRIFIDIY